MKSISTTVVKCVIFALVMLLGLLITMQALTRPVDGKSDSFTGDFKDVSGLKKGDDVRMLGVQVGKINSIDVVQSSDHRETYAQLKFTVSRNHPMPVGTKLAIRYQNLTGTRYVDLQLPKDSANADHIKGGTTFSMDQTTPSFDITGVFNGLKPVLATLAPDDINHLVQSVLAVIQGNGQGIAPVLQSVDKIVGVSNDKQKVLTALISNLGDISKKIDGNSPGLVKVLQDLDVFGRALASNNDSIREWSDQTSGVISRTNALMAALGLTPNSNPALDAVVSNALPSAEQAVNILAMIPNLLNLMNQAFPKPTPGGTVLKCTNGQASLPGLLNVLVAGQRITVCNPK
ncbi:MCE family protein [Tsukamurella sp. 8F]|uniref:MlaD family protein n=1 Tax=unclassified Tsukamurella TaxID=2633480 RepID=UPI0023B9EFA2|nr:MULTISPECIES: MCE family protein [unclassified Tsukamurella]MDF0530306.1 MCE family protein [Tsukamurella sp. 8J]MDF0587603.1 MCE family protein [Tsukamurella sp. 8F]